MLQFDAYNIDANTALKPTMAEDTHKNLVTDIIFGRWRSQTLYTGVKLGLFDLLSLTEPKSIATIAQEAGTDRDMSYRILRALATLGLVEEISPSQECRREASEFVLTNAGCLLRKNHPRSMADTVLLEEGPHHYSIWKHLPDMVTDGKQNGFIREYGQMGFDYASSHPEYNSVFNAAMSSSSRTEAENVFCALADYDFSSIKTVCDIAGGHGYLLAMFLKDHPDTQGVVIDLPIVIEDEENHLAKSMGVKDRCMYVSGDIFMEIPKADAYFIKHILHDWNDEECSTILTNTRKASDPGARLFICEYVIARPNQPSFGTFFDIHMACWGTGRERTEDEYTKILADAGWKFVKHHQADGASMSVIEAT